jgi:MtN3 and saliva related transmembrane protein
MLPADAVGWAASAVLLATLMRQVYVQWHERTTAGVSSWLFVGQMVASGGFIAYSWLLGNQVFIVTNCMIALTAIAGQLIYRRNVRRAARTAAMQPGRGPGDGIR